MRLFIIDAISCIMSCSINTILLDMTIISVKLKKSACWTDYYINRLSSYLIPIKGILKLILVIFCISWKLAIGSINDIYETLTRFLSMNLCKFDNSVISCSFSGNWIFASWTKIHVDPFKWYFNDIYQI